MKPLVVTIQSGQSLSSTPLDVGWEDLIGLDLPTGFLGSLISFRVSNANDSSGAAKDLYNKTGEEVTVAIGASHATGRLPDEVRGWRYVWIRAGSVASPTNQPSDMIVNGYATGSR